MSARARPRDNPLGFLAIFVVVLLLWALSGCGTNDQTGKPTPPPKPTTTIAVAASNPECRLVDGVLIAIPCTMTNQVAGQMVALDQILTPDPTQAPADTYGEGVYEVGVDIQPGKYKTDGGSSCYWSRLAKDGEDILDNHLGDGPNTVLVKESDGFLELARCTWKKVQ